jgi:membrane-bound lytic murein transglycosylase B
LFERTCVAQDGFHGTASGGNAGVALPCRLGHSASAVAAGLLVGLTLLSSVPAAAGASPRHQGQPGDSPTRQRGDEGEHAARALQDKQALKALVDRVAKRYGVEGALAQAVVAAESAYDPTAVSRAGALGLMQVMPVTAADYGVTETHALLDPAINVQTGIRHLKRLLEKYDNDYGRAIMAYNAGEGVVDRTDSNVTYLETLNYTEAVIRHYRRNGGRAPTEAALQKVAYLRRLNDSGRARLLLRQYLDLALPSVKSLSPLSLRDLDPGLRDTLPQRRPMAVLGAGSP